MVVFDKQKYACLSCIRGHRSSSCEHRDRILLQVRKPGRKSLSEPRSRFALVRKEQSPGTPGPCCSKSKTSEFKLVRVPSVARVEEPPRARPKAAAARTEPEDDDVVLTEKFVFVHVGDNLYRRELRPDTLPSRMSPASDARTSPREMTAPLELGLGVDPRALPPHMNGSGAGVRGMAGVDPMSGVGLAGVGGLRAGGAHHTNGAASASGGMPASSGVPHRASPPAPSPSPSDVAPLVIAPMAVHASARHAGGSNDILHELGLTTEEAEQLWPGAFDAGSDLSYAPQCVMPGQCECGDGCACADCYEHKLKFEMRS